MEEPHFLPIAPIKPESADNKTPQMGHVYVPGDRLQIIKHGHLHHFVVDQAWVDNEGHDVVVLRHVAESLFR